MSNTNIAMSKKTKKIPDLELKGFDDIDFNKEPDIQAAQKVNQPQAEETSIPASSRFVEQPVENAPAKRVDKVAQEEQTPVKSTVVPHRTSASETVRRKKIKEPEVSAKGTLAPANKKRASFNIDEDLHRALKEYSFFEEIDMVEYIFEELVKPDLKSKGYYPPRRRKRR